MILLPFYSHSTDESTPIPLMILLPFFYPHSTDSTRIIPHSTDDSTHIPLMILLSHSTDDFNPMILLPFYPHSGMGMDTTWKTP